MLDFQATLLGQGASYFFTFMAFAIIIPYIFLMCRLVYFQLSIFSIVYTNIYTLSIFPVTYSLLCVISYLRMLFTPGCTSNNSNAKCV